MNEIAALPTRKSEAFRYTDLDALADVWPVAREEIVVPSGQSTALSVVEQGDGAIARHLVIEVEAGAAFDLRVLNAGSAFGRIAIDVRLGERAAFTLGAAQLGGEPNGPRMGRVTARRGHQVLLPKGSAYQMCASKPAVAIIQTVDGPVTVKRWNEICTVGEAQ